MMPGLMNGSKSPNKTLQQPQVANSSQDQQVLFCYQGYKKVN